MGNVPSEYLPRHVDTLLEELLATLPTIGILGPRGIGKTTTAARYARSIVRLDQPREAAPFQNDPDESLARLERPVLLDEWQIVPQVLGAVKRAVDAQSQPAQFIITGSVRAELDAAWWPGTGRLVRVPMTGLTIAEINHRATERPFIDVVAELGSAGLQIPSEPLTITDYVALALQSGFPEAAMGTARTVREIWLDSYIDQLITKDAEQIATGRDPDRLRRYLEAFALNTAGVVEHKTLYESAGITRKTADSYDMLLKALGVVHTVPPWLHNRLKRLIRTPKRYLADPALAAALVNANADTILRDGTLLGRLLDTFVMAQLRGQLPVCRGRPRLYHLRQQDGSHEVDIIVELGGFRIIAIEVKAEAGPNPTAAKHLAWLRDELRDRFVAGIVLHTGPGRYQLGDRVTAVPICTLWS